MQFYTPANLPVLSTLAMSYAVSDAWFCSVPSQTSPNRVFSLSGTSSGYVDNYSKPGSDPLDIVRFGQRSIFNLLSDSGNNDWCIYWQKHLLQPIPLTAEIMKQVDELTKAQPANRQPVTEFFNTIANGGTLPAFSFLEPVFMPEHDIPASDYHPPYNIYPGEQYLADVYNALTTYKDWNTTLFIVTFDEHGGTMDHVPPPSTIAPDAMTDWSEFTFNRLGVRIPTLLISPMIQGGTVFRSPDNAVPFDHTSFVRTLLGWQNIDISGGAMGARAVQAPDFSGVLSSSVVNPGQISLSPLSCTAVPDEIPMNDLQRFMLPMIVRELTENSPEIYYEVLSQLMEMQTVTEVRTFAEKLIGGK
jgi:phospholipase C